jgi:hypothetical protein
MVARQSVKIQKKILIDLKPKGSLGWYVILFATYLWKGERMWSLEKCILNFLHQSSTTPSSCDTTQMAKLNCNQIIDKIYFQSRKPSQLLFHIFANYSLKRWVLLPVLYFSFKLFTFLFLQISNANSTISIYP